MKKAVTMLIAAALSTTTALAQTVDTYRFTMNLKVPRIYDNMASKGYRKLQPQKLVGELQFIYRSDGTTRVRVLNLVNKTHKISGVPISYVCYDYPYGFHEPLVVGIGNNRTRKFRQGGATFAFQADPSYNIGAVDEDNTLILELSGYGTLSGNKLRRLKGSVRGQIGCGCQAYGHISPTRIFHGWLTDIVYDVAPLYGTFKAVYRNRRVEADEPDEEPDED